MKLSELADVIKWRAARAEAHEELSGSSDGARSQPTELAAAVGEGSLP